MNEFCIPNLTARRFEEIDFDQVLTEQRRFLCLDLDNTLITQTGETFSPKVLAKLNEIRESGRVEDICLVSNVIFPGPRLTRLRRLAKVLDISNVVPCFFFTRKPKPAPYLQAMKLMKAKPEESIMVGDQIFTDIVGGNKLGFYTIWLETMSKDHWTTRLTGRRKKEILVRKTLKERGLLPSS